MPDTINIELELVGRKVAFKMAVDKDNLADQELMMAMRIGGCPEPEVTGLMARVLKPGDYAIDGGANIGFFSILMSRLVGDGQVLAFEPGDNNLYKLKENLAVNQCENVEIVPQPLWDKEESVKLHLCVDGSKNSLAAHPDTRGHQFVEAATLDDWATASMLRDLRLIKLDIEGAEEKALRGGTALLANHPYIVLEINTEALPKFGSSAASLCDFLREYDYSPFLLHFDGSLPTLIPRGTKVHPRMLNWNVLFSTIENVGKAWPEIVA